jgi:uncharacterized protein
MMSENAAVQNLTLRWNEPLAVEVTAAVQRGDAGRLRALLARHPGLATTRIVKEGEQAGERTLLHLFADWPGHRRNPQEIVSVLVGAGADVGARPDDSETPLHWAASNDDVELVDALLDAGADVNAPGSIIGGLGPVADAAVFGGYRAGRRLVERGAPTNLYQASALGLTDRVRELLTADPGPDAELVTTSFWAACCAGQQAIAALLLEAGADINWVGWDHKTPLDAATSVGADALADWLRERGARPASN